MVNLAVRVKPDLADLLEYQASVPRDHQVEMALQDRKVHQDHEDNQGNQGNQGNKDLEAN